MRRRWLLALPVVCAVGSWGLCRHRGDAPAKAAPAPVVEPSVTDPAYASTIQPLLDRRCVVCHSCFDSPCQLNLQSFEGLDRGANAQAVYQASRLAPIHPTRMFQDAQTTAEWRRRFGFFPVIARPGPATVDLEDSLLWREVQQRARDPGGGPFDVDKAAGCWPSVGVLGADLRAHPTWGMPFGFPPLAAEDLRALEAWLRGGAGGPGAAPGEEANAATGQEIARWEGFLNAPDPKSRLVARYLFEHLFFAHLSLSSAPGEWFRLVRSRTAAPSAVEEIATARPYDDPGVPAFSYRLRRLRETIVEKTHVPYRLDDAKLARLRRLFVDADWQGADPAFPSYAREVAANPFVAFRAIPARARYQFLLDDALYHVSTFIHGPVCRGQVALDVIDEHFLIFFLSPDADPTLLQRDFLDRFAGDLAVPAEGGDGVEAIYAPFKVRELDYLHGRGALLRRYPGRELRDVWDGEGTNRDAVLTVYRHFDSAFVLRGAIGGVPKTAWVLDYPVFERMYYDLVAGFDVFGNVVHQVSTRRYMNLLRIEAEANFLAFLPEAQRSAVRASWYRPQGVSAIVDVLDPAVAGPETRVPFTDPAHAKEELVRRLVVEGGLPAAVVGPREPVQWTDVPIAGDAPEARFDRAARGFAAQAGAFVQVFPDVALVRIRTGGTADAVRSIIRNKAHLNIDFMFLEDAERAPAEDTLHVVPGVATSKPNLFLTVDAADVERFAAEVRALTATGDAWSRFVGRYGARREDREFWAVSDFFNARFRQIAPEAAGILDLSRYTND